MPSPEKKAVPKPDVSFETFGLNAQLLRSPKPMGRIHHHHEVEMNYVFKGGITYLHRGSVRRLEAGRMAVFWGSTPHTLVEVDPGSEMAWITVPLSWIWSWGLPERFTSEIMGGQWWYAPLKFAGRFPVSAWVKELHNPNRAQQRRLLLELEACFLWLADQAPHAPAKSAERWTTAESVAGLRRVESMARLMAEKFQENLMISDIARAAGLHPNYAMPLFKRYCGVTVHSYLLQYRLTHAQRLLLTTDDKIIDVALASGFGSESAFYSAFSKMVKDTPQAFRTRMDS